mmetsp:Transcript_32997/g.94798  ORF Transcript_32997/g.94798 Transcript_32997/m.94798 type:complete len:352 (+) Transcript_32997:2368-3423(+)
MRWQLLGDRVLPMLQSPELQPDSRPVLLVEPADLPNVILVEDPRESIFVLGHHDDGLELLGVQQTENLPDSADLDVLLVFASLHVVLMKGLVVDPPSLAQLLVLGPSPEPVPVQQQGLGRVRLQPPLGGVGNVGRLRGPRADQRARDAADVAVRRHASVSAGGRLRDGETTADDRGRRMRLAAAGGDTDHDARRFRGRRHRRHVLLDFGLVQSDLINWTEYRGVSEDVSDLLQKALVQTQLARLTGAPSALRLGVRGVLNDKVVDGVVGHLPGVAAVCARNCREQAAPWSTFCLLSKQLRIQLGSVGWLISPWSLRGGLASGARLRWSLCALLHLADVHAGFREDGQVVLQ